MRPQYFGPFSGLFTQVWLYISLSLVLVYTEIIADTRMFVGGGGGGGGWGSSHQPINLAWPYLQIAVLLYHLSFVGYPLEGNVQRFVKCNFYVQINLLI